MNQHKAIISVLKPHFKLHTARLNFIALFILALIKVRTVNLVQIATALNGKVEIESNTKRAKRFLSFDFAQDLVAQFVLSFVTDEKLVLTVDRFLPLTAAPDGLGPPHLRTAPLNPSLRLACTLLRSSFLASQSGSVTTTDPCLRLRTVVPVSHHVRLRCQDNPASCSTSRIKRVLICSNSGY